jgi:hypothetical protein
VRECRPTARGACPFAEEVRGAERRRKAAERSRRRRQRLRDQAAREAADAAAALWGPLDARTRQRTAMEIAAKLLEEAPSLADWLRRARPEHARDVALGVARHALEANFPIAFDVLRAANAFDLPLPSEHGVLVTPHPFRWKPKPEWLAP